MASRVCSRVRMEGATTVPQSVLSHFQGSLKDRSHSGVIPHRPFRSPERPSPPAPSDGGGFVLNAHGLTGRLPATLGDSCKYRIGQALISSPLPNAIPLSSPDHPAGSASAPACFLRGPRFLHKRPTSDSCRLSRLRTRPNTRGILSPRARSSFFKLHRGGGLAFLTPPTSRSRGRLSVPDTSGER